MIVIAQDGTNHRGTILDEPHPLPGWVWVDWDHIGICDEYEADLTRVPQ